MFFGAGSICTDQYLHGAGGLGLLGIALAHGLAIAVMVSALGHISGGHFNPAVTFAFALTKRIALPLAGVYVVAQLAGASLAALLLNWIYSAAVRGPAHLGAPALGATTSPG